MTTTGTPGRMSPTMVQIGLGAIGPERLIGPEAQQRAIRQALSAVFGPTGVKEAPRLAAFAAWRQNLAASDDVRMRRTLEAARDAMAGTAPGEPVRTGRSFRSDAHAPTLDELEPLALEEAREIFGHDRLEVSRKYDIHRSTNFPGELRASIAVYELAEPEGS